MKKISFLILFLISFTACEDKLNLKPLGSLSDADFWANEATIQGYVDYAYHMLAGYTHKFRDQGRVGTMGHFRSEATDVAFAHIPHGGGQALTSGAINPSSDRLIGSWLDFYKVIQHINVFFQNHEDGRVNVAEDKETLWLAEMHMLRAYSYHQLLQAHGGVIISTKPFTPDDPIDQTRATYDEGVDFVLSEISLALPGLPDDAIPGKMTKAFALGMKARMLLHHASALHNPSGDVSRWAKVEAAAKALLDLNQFSLYDPDFYGDIFHHTISQGNSEIILSKHMEGEGLIFWFNFPTTIFGVPSWGGWGLGTPIQKFVDAFEMADGTPYDRAIHGATPYENRDPRFYANILYDGAEFSKTMPRVPSADDIGYQIESGIYTEMVNGAAVTRPGYDRQGGVLQETKNFTRTGYYCHKYVRDNTTQKFNPGEPTQFIMMRLTEFYLIMAEALVMQGKGAEARNYLLPIRQRVDLPDSSLPAVITMDEIMQERYVELSFEDFRFWDVRRWKILDQTFTDAYGVTVNVDRTVDPEVRTYDYFMLQERNFDEKLYYMPIPQGEIDKNPLIVQNPGWGAN